MAKKYLLLAIIASFITTQIPAMDQDPREKESVQEKKSLSLGQISALVDKIFNEIWWTKGTSERISLLENNIKSLFEKYSKEDLEPLLNALTKKMIDNIGGYTGGLTSKIKGQLSGGSSTSSNLVLAHYVSDLMTKLNMPLSKDCKTWQVSYGQYNIPYRKEVSCIDYLVNNPVEEKQKHQENIPKIIKEFQSINEQKELGISGLNNSFFEEISKSSNDGDDTVHQPFLIELGLKDGFSSIKKLGIFYGALLENSIEKKMEEIRKLGEGIKDGTSEKVAFDKKIKEINDKFLEQLDRYKDEIANFRAIDPTMIKITKDGAAMVMIVGNEISIVFGGMGVGEGGMEAGQKLAYKFNNPPLKFQSGLGGAHEGFYIRLMESWNEIYTFCAEHALSNKSKLSDYNFKIVGHSMGGGVAPIAALRLALLTFKGNPGNKIQVITFGAPRTLDSTLAHSYNQILGENTYMFVHDGDSNVPEQPPTFLGYVHVGKRFLIPQPKVSDDPSINRKVFHQYAGYKNVLDTSEIGWNDERSILGITIAKEESGKSFYLETGKNIILSPLRGLMGIFSGYEDLIEDKYSDVK